MALEAIFSSRVLETGLAYLSSVLATAVVFRLWREGLHTTYKAFTALMVYDVASTLLMMTMTYHTDWYGLLWMAVEGIKLLLYAAVTLELFEVVLRPYPGIAKAGQTVVRASLVVATLLTLLTLQIDLSHIQTLNQRVLPYFFAIQRTFLLTLAVFQVFVIAFLSWFQVRLSWNARIYASLLVVFFSFKSFGMFSIIMLGRTRTRTFSMVVLAVLCACEAAWALLLRQSGEDVETNATLTGRRTSPIALTAKLEALNMRLSEATKQDKKGRG